jgi:hypothetical protein
MSDTSNPFQGQPFNQFLTVCFRVTIFLIVIYFLYTSLNGKPSGIILLVGFLFLYLFTYIYGRFYIVPFDDWKAIDQIVGNNETTMNAPENPYAIAPIDSVDDYDEVNMIFENENDKELTKKQRNKLMSQYPLDWTVQPPSSTHFQAGMKESFQDVSGVYDASGADILYRDINGSNLRPADTDAAEINEREVLQTYVPKNANDLKTYDVDDAYTLIKNMYSAKGLIPEVEHDKNTNIYKT